jgi:hypothetical protein
MIRKFPAIDENGKITAKRGATFDLELTWYLDAAGTVPRPFASCAARMQVRSAAGVLQFTASSAASTIILGAANGVMTFAVSAVMMAAQTAGEYVYDIEITDGTGAIEKTETKPFVIQQDQTQ